MKIKLFKRHYGIHRFIKEVEFPRVLLKTIYKGEDNIDEVLLLTVMPENFLPKGIQPNKVLLMVANSDGIGSTGQRGLKLFRNWSKYYDSFSIELS